MSLRPFLLRVVVSAAALALGAGTVSCSSTPDAPLTPAANLPKWEGDLRDLYPDRIDPAVLGLMAPKQASRSDRLLWTRATTADVVGRASVTTFDSSQRDRANGQTYVLTVTFDDPPLAKPRVAENSFQVTIDPTNESYGMLSVLDSRIKEHKFVAIIKRFAGKDDEVVVHFYFYPLSAGYEEVVQEAVAVEEIKDQ
jgi:hypothetical protein